MRKNLFKKLLITGGIMLVSCNLTTALAHEVDITPPNATIQVLTDTSGGVDAVDVRIVLTSDEANPGEIKYAVSNQPFSNTEKYTGEWQTYTTNNSTHVEFESGATTGRVHAILMDGTGNTSRVYTGVNTEYTVRFNANAYNVQNMPTSVTAADFIGNFGAPYAIPNQPPRKSGAFFLGWSTDPSASEASYDPGDIIEAEAFSVGANAIDLYAIWTRDTDDLPLLSTVVSIGDYVRYPVYYTNIQLTRSDKTNDCTYEGWRVIDVTSDGEVKLVSAGIPLGYALANGNVNNNITALGTNFLTTAFSTSDTKTSAGQYTKANGFSTYGTLTSAFTNAYTKMSGSKPVVQALTGQDVFDCTAKLATQANMPSIALSSIDTNTNMKEGAYDNLFDIGGCYWIVHAGSGNAIYFVNESGACSSEKKSENGIRPVVTLKANVYATERDREGYWDIYVE